MHEFKTTDIRNRKKKRRESALPSGEPLRLRKIMIAVMTGTGVLPRGEKVSTHGIVFARRSTWFSVLTFLLLASWSVVCFWLRRRDTPSSDTLTWFLGFAFPLSLLLIARTINVCFNERMNEKKKVDNDLLLS